MILMYDVVSKYSYKTKSLESAVHLTQSEDIQESRIRHKVCERLHAVLKFLTLIGHEWGIDPHEPMRLRELIYASCIWSAFGNPIVKGLNAANSSLHTKLPAVSCQMSSDCVLRVVCRVTDDMWYIFINKVPTSELLVHWSVLGLTADSCKLQKHTDLRSVRPATASH